MAIYTLKPMSRLETGTSPDGLKVTVKYLMAPATSAARASAYSDFMGGIGLVRGRLIYKRPARDSVFPWLYCKSFTTEPMEEDALSSDGTTYLGNQVMVTVSYEPRTAEAEDQEDADKPETPEAEDAPDTELLKREWDFSTRALTLPNRFMKWGTTVGGGGADVLIGNDGIAAVKIQPQIDYVITRHFVRNKPSDAITQQLGCVNKNDFYLYGERYRPECLRFDSAKDSQIVTTQGIKCFEMVYKFAICPIYDYLVEATNPVPDAGGKGYVGWNRLFNPRVCKYERCVWQTNAGRGIYLLDKDQPTQTLYGKTVSGFMLLFNARAR